MWRPGRTAEAMRTASILCLYAAFKHSVDASSPFAEPTVLRIVTEPLVPLLLTLIEDSSKKTRLITCRALCRMIKLLRITGLYTANLVHQVYPGMILYSCNT